MSSWINDANVANHNGNNGFAHLTDPSATPGAMMDPSAFMANRGQFNPQFANPQQMVAMQNGQMRNASPPFANPMYQTNPVIPSKRPRPREDSLGQSPRQAPGMLPASRAETPQQSPFPGFQQGAMSQQQSGQPSPYPHLQTNGSGNATPSPIMGNQMRPASVPQRVSTTSPHPFSPAAQQFPQASPVPSDHGGTPQPNPYMQQNNFAQGFNPQFTQTQSPARPSPAPNAMSSQIMPQQMGQMPQQMGQMGPQMGGQIGGQIPGQMGQQMGGQMPGQLPNQMFPQQLSQARNVAEQKLLYQQMQLQQQLQRNNMQMQQMPGQNMGQVPGQGQMNPAQARNMMAARQAMANGQMPANPMMRPQQPSAGRVQNPEQFMKHLTMFMTTKQLPLDPTPNIDGRPINLMVLFQTVSKFHGYRNVTQASGWPQISQAVGFHPQQNPTAPLQLKSIYEKNLLKFEEALAAQQQKTRMHQQGMGGMANMSQPGAAPKGAPHNYSQMQPGPMMQPAQQPHPPPQQGPMQTPIKQSAPQPSAVDAFSPTQPVLNQQQVAAAPGHPRNSLSRSIQPNSTAEEFPAASPAQSKAGSVPVAGATQADDTAEVTTLRFPAPFNSNPEEYFPCSREIVTYGGVDIATVNKLAQELEKWKPDLPPAAELGNIDIHALTKSIQSGIHGEVRLALDTLALVTCSTQPNLYLDLRYCEDLMETLIECAEDQVDMLVESTVEVSDEVLINSYEEVARACRLEKLSVRCVPVFGSADYELDRAVDRLICVTTILRNLSFFPDNHRLLAEETVVKFLCVVIRYLGTRNMLLRTQANTLDFMKDVIILLSNVSTEVEIPGREQALCLLQFLLAFAPSPGPTLTDDRLFFSPYEPALHPYLPPAVDSLAKLFARDEPNRTHYRAILITDVSTTSTIPYELLTRTFALAISVIPDPSREKRSDLPSLVESRKPILMQGLLAADIMASIAPGHDSGVTRSWLVSGTGFAQNLFWHIRNLSSYFEAQRPRSGAPGRHQNKRDTELVYIVGLAVSMLRKLCERSRDPSDPTGEKSIPPNVLPSRDSVLGALQMTAQEWSEQGMLADLVAYASLED